MNWLSKQFLKLIKKRYQIVEKRVNVYQLYQRDTFLGLFPVNGWASMLLPQKGYSDLLEKVVKSLGVKRISVISFGGYKQKIKL